MSQPERTATLAGASEESEHQIMSALLTGDYKRLHFTPKMILSLTKLVPLSLRHKHYRLRRTAHKMIESVDLIL
jgi:hypothetical protein